MSEDVSGRGVAGIFCMVRNELGVVRQNASLVNKLQLINHD